MFYFIRWLVPGHGPRGSQSFATLRACRNYARRAMYAHPSWGWEIVEHLGSAQTVIDTKEA